MPSPNAAGDLIHETRVNPSTMQFEEVYSPNLQQNGISPVDFHEIISGCNQILKQTPVWLPKWLKLLFIMFIAVFIALALPTLGASLIPCLLVSCVYRSKHNNSYNISNHELRKNLKVYVRQENNYRLNKMGVNLIARFRNSLPILEFHKSYKPVVVTAEYAPHKASGASEYRVRFAEIDTIIPNSAYYLEEVM